MKTLFANGCSFSTGAGLPYCDDMRYRHIVLDQIWAKHLSNHLNCESYVNLAQPCGSNQRMFRTTFNWILQQPQSILNNTVAVIQFTDGFRYEYYVSKDNYQWENDCHQWTVVKEGVLMCPGLSTDEREFELREIENRFKKYTYEDDFYKFLTWFHAFDNLFKQHNIEYYIWDRSHRFPTIPINYMDYIVKNFNYLNNEPPYFLSYDTIPNDGHPSLQGHIDIANILYDRIKKLNLYNKYSDA